MLKRLYGTPLPHAAYFVGKIVQVFVCLIAEVDAADGRGRGVLSPAPAVHAG